jgi:hypothetical protein
MSEQRGYRAVAEACKTSQKLGLELSRGPAAAPRLACLDGCHELDPRHSLGNEHPLSRSHNAHIVLHASTHRRMGMLACRKQGARCRASLPCAPWQHECCSPKAQATW